MDLSPGSIISGLILGAVGTALFIYGKKQQEIPCMIAGVALCTIPYFVASILANWLIAAACIGGLYYRSRLA